MVQVCISGKQSESWLKSRAEECQQAESQPARRPGSRLAGEVTPELLCDHAPQTAQATLSQPEIVAAQPFLRPINPRRPAGAKQWILHVHRHHQFAEAPAHSRGADVF